MMETEKKLCYISSIHRTLNIPIIYRNGNTKYNFQPFEVSSGENDWEFILNRLDNVFKKFPDSNALYFVHDSLVMFGMVINNATDEFIFIGPVASSYCSEKDIADYLFGAGLSAEATNSMTAYLNANKRFNLAQLQELVVNVNLIFNDEIITTENLISIYDSEKANKIKLANKSFNEEDERQELLNLEATEKYTEKLNHCILNGDVEKMKELLMNLGNIPYTEQYIQSLKDVRIAAIGAIFVAHNVALKSKTNTEDLERIKQFYLMKVTNVQEQQEINGAVTSALIDFTNAVKKNKSNAVEDPTINKVIKYIERNITEKLLAADIADAMNISLSYLFKKFKAETGKMLVQYINEEKIKKAIYYLTFTDKSIMDIAIHLSFSSQAYFQTIFKNVTGQTPTKYRAANHI